jgi:hypothetical protein
MAKMPAARNGRADLPVSQDAQQRVPTTNLKPSALVEKVMLDRIFCGKIFRNAN